MTRSGCCGLLALATVLIAGTAHGGSVAGMATVGGQAASGAIVYLEAQTPPAAAKTPPRIVMDQKDLAFEPGTLPVARGTVVEFRNSDDVEHNVFSPSQEVTHFDLGTYRRGESRSVVFDEVGEILVLCNIHMEMAATIVVLRDPFFARAGRDGTYRIEAVPPGAYTMRIWRDGWLPITHAVEVRDSGVLTVDVTAP
jgi:plastocyanin